MANFNFLKIFQRILPRTCEGINKSESQNVHSGFNNLDCFVFLGKTEKSEVADRYASYRGLEGGGGQEFFRVCAYY
jgi:hypothetical protein